MPVASLFALALLAAAEVAPPAPAPTSNLVDEQPVPAGAPSDDYGLVNWCTGALSGHMLLYRAIKPQLDLLDRNPKENAVLDADQMKAGQEYLTLYKRATDAAEKASPQPIYQRGEAQRRAGQAIWMAATNATDKKAAMWTWLSWELPGRCETAAERLYEKSLLSAQALGIDLVGGASAAANAPVTPQLSGSAPAVIPLP
jgi:hypothetical protein